MTPEESGTLDRRVLILAPTGRDGTLAQAMLANAEIEASICADVASLAKEASAGASCLLVSEEAITPGGRKALAEMLARQPRWSDLPLLLLTSPGATSKNLSQVLEGLGTSTLVERPVRAATLVSLVRSAIRARQRQYEIRNHYEDQALLAAIVESSADAIISKTPQGIILSWNAGAERIFGYAAAEAIGKPIKMLIPADRQDEERMILERLLRGERIDHFETIRLTKDGRPIEISLAVSPVRDADGRIVAASKVARDITLQKQAERALRQADRRKDEFLATLAHELRNPLAPIRNSLHILQLAGRSDPAVEHVRGMMERQVSHMVRLVDDLMEVSRITRGKIELRKELVELASILRTAVETSQPLIDDAGHQLELSIPPEPMALEADPIRLAQVFTNLLNNAANYTEGPGRILLEVRREGAAAVIRVCDTGIGIPADKLPQIFEMFTQVHGPHGVGQGGLGIGLTLVRSLVQMHGGSVAAYSEGLNKGSEFVVRLPLAEGFVSRAAPAQGGDSAYLPLRVLVVDDNRDAADSLGMLIQFLGAEVHVVHSGPSALEAVESFRPTLMLLDLGMPGMDGLEVARRIRQKPEHRDLILIALTGWGQESDRRRSRAAGFDHHLIKPTGLDALQALLLSIRKHQGAGSRQTPHPAREA